MNESELQNLSRQIRELCLRTLYRSQTAHLGSNLSAVDILAVLYGEVLNINPADPSWEERDRFILSKGHGCLAVYAALALKGFFPAHWLETYYQNGGKLAGHITASGVPGVEVSTGSLGHGLSIGCGMALAAKREKKPYRVFVLLSDGELDEGSNWEAILFAPHHKLENLVAIVDYNKIQSFGRTKEVLDLDPLGEKWRACGWKVEEVDGHRIGELQEVFARVPFSQTKPSCVIAHTVKGKGVPFLEDTLASHYSNLTEEQLLEALAQP